MRRAALAVDTGLSGDQSIRSIPECGEEICDGEAVMLVLTFKGGSIVFDLSRY